MNSIQVFVSSRMSKGELDADRAAACQAITEMGPPFSVFAFPRLPDPPLVLASDAEYEIYRSRVFLLLVAHTLSPRTVDELRFAQRRGLHCAVLTRDGVERKPELSAFLSNCGCPVYSYGSPSIALGDAIRAVLRQVAEWEPVGQEAIHESHDAWTYLVKSLSSGSARVFDLTPRKFEELVAELLHRFGYRVTLTPMTNDGGRDIIASRSSDLVFPSTYFIETKLWSPDRRVGRPVIQQLVGAGTGARVNGVMLVTTSSFARTVPEYIEASALANYVRLVSGDALPTWYANYLRQVGSEAEAR